MKGEKVFLSIKYELNYKYKNVKEEIIKIKDEDICPVCSFPKELCICEKLEAEDQQIEIYNEKRRWGKIVTVVKFEGDFNLDLDKLSTNAKKICASGGTFRDNTIEVQGDHRFKLKKFLIEQGFSQKEIRIRD